MIDLSIDRSDLFLHGGQASDETLHRQQYLTYIFLERRCWGRHLGHRSQQFRDRDPFVGIPGIS
jgi:hypothetical protein